MAQNRVIDVDDGELESFLRRRMTKRQQIAQCFPGRYRLYRMNNAMVERLYEQVKDQIKLVPEFKYGMVPAKTSADTESGKATPPAGENELSPTHSGNEPSGGELKQSGAESPYMPPGEDRSQVGEARQAVCGEDVGRSGEVGVVSPARITNANNPALQARLDAFKAYKARRAITGRASVEQFQAFRRGNAGLNGGQLYAKRSGFAAWSRRAGKMEGHGSVVNVSHIISEATGSKGRLVIVGWNENG